MQSTSGPSAAERTAFEEANEWDASRIERIERSERRAWWVAGAGWSVAALAVAAVIVMATRYTVEPYLYRENGETGAVDQITRLRDIDLSGDEVRDKHWIGRFIEACETYDWWTLQRDYDACGLFSSSEVGQRYAAQFSGEDALQDRWRDGVRATVDIKSIVPAGNTATVRFAKTTRRTRAGAEPEVDHWIATLAFEYDTEARVSESDRRVNPWGFKVNSYRIDPEQQGGAS